MNISEMKRNRREQHKFTGEFRAKVDRRVWPEMDKDTLWELFAKHIDEGTEIEGITFTYYSVRGKEITYEQAKDEYFFITTATSVAGDKKS